MTRKLILAATTIVGSLVLANACSSTAPSPSNHVASAAGSGTATCTTAALTSLPAFMGDKSDSTTGLGLTGTPPSVGYTDTVQAVLTRNCTSCHTATGQAPDLSSYAAASAAANDSLDQIAIGAMPPNGVAMSATDKTNFVYWVTGGELQTGAGTGGSGTSGSSTSGSGTTSNASGTTAVATPAAPAPAPTTPATAAASGTPCATAPASPSPTAPASPAPTPTPSPATGSGTSTTSGTAALTYTSTIKAILTTSCVGCHSTGGQAPDLSTYTAASAAAATSLSAMQSGGMPPAGNPTVPAASLTSFQAWVTAGTPQ